MGLWDGVHELVDRASRASDLTFHGLELFAARRFRDTGREAPPELREAERVSATLGLIAPLVIERVRAAYDGPAVLMKGPEAACSYPDPTLRPFRDLDLLVPSAAETHRALLDAGFQPAGIPERYHGIHHLQPLYAPGLPLLVEVHDRPKWIAGLPQPSREELLAATMPSRFAPDAALAFEPALHAIVLAAHSWAHLPLGRLIHLLDLAAVAAEADRTEIDRLAERYGMRRVWRASIATADALFEGGPRPWSLRIWARNLEQARERNVLEAHLARWLPAWWTLSPVVAARETAGRAVRSLMPRPDETWRTKARRTAYAVRGAFRRLSDHHQHLAGGTADP